MDMTGKIVVVTGASRGIGAQAARTFASAGARVALLARNTGEINDMATEIGAGALPVQCDVSDHEQVVAAMAAVVDGLGAVDVLVNNAGVIQPISRFRDSDPQLWAQAIQTNLCGVYSCMRAALPIMLAAGGGSVLTVSSGAAHGPIEGWSAYCASKAGAAMLTRCLDKEERDNGIRAIGLSPGTVATQMQRDIKVSGINPVSQMDWSDHISPELPARALLWMCSPEADDFLGAEVSLKDADTRRRIGLGV
jgi:NAD(P)-dependent dehydrogenase (short-subunit alcohol dehydrogenase family)